jgi:hypothetical protein
MNANQIMNEFISLLRQAGERQSFSCQPWFQGTRRMSNNIVELSGSVNCLVYIKVRSEEPYRWGVTTNRIDELRQSGKNWVIVLLYETTETGYLLTPNDVNRYLSIWPLGSDGDYKVATGSYLRFNRPFHSFTEFLNRLRDSCRMETLITSSPTTLGWLNKIKTRTKEKISSLIYGESKYWASLKSHETNRNVVYLLPQKSQIRLFTRLDVSFDAVLQPTPSSSRWAEMYPSIFLIKSKNSVDKAVELIIASYNEDLRK